MFRKYTFSLFQGTHPSLLRRMMVCLASVSRVPWISWGSWASLSLFLCCTLGFYTTYACQDSSLVLHCPQNSVINIQSAFYGRRSDKICPFEDGASGKSQHRECKWERLKCSCRISDGLNEPCRCVHCWGHAGFGQEELRWQRVLFPIRSRWPWSLPHCL